MQKIKVLIADDTKTSRALLRQSLQSFQFEFSFSEAEDGKEAIEIFIRERPSIVFIDLELPIKSGLQAIPEIRKLSANVNIVVVSSKVTDKIKDFLKLHNVDEIITKPFKMADLTHIMAKYAPEPIKKVKILIADDTKTVREILTKYCKLPALDIFITHAEDGEKALIEFRTCVFDMVFLDINMPKIDGIKVLQMMEKVRPSSRVIMLTGDRTEATIRTAISSGANGYVAKPFTIEQIQGCLEKLL